MKKSVKLFSVLMVLIFTMGTLSLSTFARGHRSFKNASDTSDQLLHNKWNSTYHSQWHENNGSYNSCNWEWSESELNHSQWNEKEHSDWHEENKLYGVCNGNWAEDNSHQNWDDSYHNQCNDNNRSNCGHFYYDNSTLANNRSSRCQ